MCLKYKGYDKQNNAVAELLGVFCLALNAMALLATGLRNHDSS